MHQRGKMDQWEKREGYLVGCAFQNEHHQPRSYPEINKSNKINTHKIWIPIGNTLNAIRWILQVTKLS